ncbi:MAG: two-component system, OmpR family, sensor kinase [Gaiellaceae bacterium]|nr:two-component system, OmpR family, sensor kinase [Gaiellaceae bacterium]
MLRPWRDVRSRLLIIVVVALALALGVATIGFNALFDRATSGDANSLLRARAESEVALIGVRAGRLAITEGRDDALADSQVWIFSADGTAVEAPRARAATNRVARSLSGSSTRFADVPSTDVRLYAVPIIRGGRRLGTLVTGVSLAPYEQTKRSALVSSIALALVLLATVAAAVFLLLKAAFGPITRMTTQAASWSEHDLDRRFAAGHPHDEVTRLAAMLDSLLDRIAASLRHERRFSAEVSHELRTPLARAVTAAELALRRDRTPAEYREALASVLENIQQVARIVDALVASARQEAGAQGIAEAGAVLASAVAACETLAAERGVTIDIVAGPDSLVGLDGDLAERIVQPVLENACRYAAQAVSVEAEHEGRHCVLRVRDDGPGVAAEERERIFEPGVRGAAGLAAGPGAGLGLALARRLARAASGDIEVLDAGRGAAFAIRLPAA